MEYPIYEEYPAVYRDAHGEEQTTVSNDGRELRMTVRGVEFTATTPTSFEPAEGTPPDALSSFCLDTGYKLADLCGCTIEYQIPMPLLINGVSVYGNNAGVLRVTVILGMPDKRHVLDVETLRLELTYDGEIYRGTGWGGAFETDLLDIQKILPDGVIMHACINCAYSDYSPFGSGAFGGMMCFRDNKEAYLQVKTKYDMFRVEGTYTELVQETYRCPEFARRVPGTGYRG